ncbi:radical SAM protein [Streptomyces sp. NPDC050732]|uniref:radical SAM/SPASM domain-containing protein n=1 Tax=Streptomyces sp. NPDC050732 TaxID=3154632 RepID=UPI003436111D
MLAKSRYVIVSENTYTDAAGRRGRLVYNTATTRVSLLGQEAARQLEQSAPDDMPPALADRLRGLGLLTELTPEQEMQDVVAAQKAAADDTADRAFVLLPTSYCNMGCDYCGQTHVRGGLTPDHRGHVVDRVLTAMAQPGTDRVEVRWFGGEPMMAYAVLLAMSKEFVAGSAATGTPYRATMTTNGALLTVRKTRRLYDDCALREVCITLDGPAEIHDEHRPLKSGQRSYQRILDLLRDLVAEADTFPELSVILRVNIDVRNRGHVSELMHDLAAAGMAHPMVTIDLHGVYAWSNDVSEVRLDREDLARQEVEWIREILGLGMNHAVLPRARAGKICPAVTRSQEVISSSGSVFSCTEHPLVDRHEREDVLTPVVDLPTPRLRPRGDYDDWHEKLSTSSVPCSGCAFLPVCGGSCPKHWSENDPPCPPFKTNLQGRMDVAAALNGLTTATDELQHAGGA